MAVRVLIFVLFAGCGDDEEGPPTLPGTLEPPCALLEEERFRATSIRLPQSTEDAIAMALNIDEDPIPRMDNNAGVSIRNVFALGVDVQPHLQAALDAGVVGWMIAWRQCEDGSYLRLSLLQSDEATGSASVPAVGQLVGQSATATRGISPWPISSFFSLDADLEGPTWIRGYAVTYDLSRAGDVLSGRIGAALDDEMMRAALVDPLAASFTSVLQNDPACPAMCETLAFYDDDSDAVISTNEMEQWVGVYVQYDLDMLATSDGETVFWPGHDDVPDTVSIGLQVEFQRVP